jgi:hypothetical protein
MAVQTVLDGWGCGTELQCPAPAYWPVLQLAEKSPGPCVRPRSF